MKNSTIYIFIIIILILIDFFIIKRMFLVGSELEKYQKHIEAFGIIQVNEQIARTSENILLNDSIVLSDKENSKVKIKEILAKNSGEPILVFRYSEIDCNICIDSCIEAINRILPLSLREKLLIISNYNSLRDLFVFIRVNKIKGPIYNLSGSLGTELERHIVPYFFILKNDMRTDFVFVPEKSIPKRTEDYLKFVTSYLNGQNR